MTKLIYYNSSFIVLFKERRVWDLRMFAQLQINLCVRANKYFFNLRKKMFKIEDYNFTIYFYV